MNGAVDSVAGFGTVTLVVAFAGPALTLIFIAVFWFGRRRFRLPAVLVGIPLALTSIVPQVLIGAFGILTAFQEIASQKRAGVRAVSASLAEVTGSFATAIALSIGCVAALVVFQVICSRRDEETESNEAGNKLGPRIVFFMTAAAGLATMGLLWFFERTLDLIMVVVDSTRKFEAEQRLGGVPIGEVAGVLSRRLLLCELFSFALLAFLVTAPFWLLAGEAPEWVRERSLTLAIVIGLCLIPFGIAYHAEIVYVISLAGPK